MTTKLIIYPCGCGEIEDTTLYWRCEHHRKINEPAGEGCRSRTAITIDDKG